MSEWKNGYFLDYIELNPKVVLKKEICILLSIWQVLIL